MGKLGSHLLAVERCGLEPLECPWPSAPGTRPARPRGSWGRAAVTSAEMAASHTEGSVAGSYPKCASPQRPPPFDLFLINMSKLKIKSHGVPPRGKHTWAVKYSPQ